MLMIPLFQAYERDFLYKKTMCEVIMILYLNRVIFQTGRDRLFNCIVMYFCIEYNDRVLNQ